MGRGAAALGPEKEQENRKIKRDERSAAEKHCQPLACQLQQCASRFIYAQHKCDNLKRCWSAFVCACVCLSVYLSVRLLVCWINYRFVRLLGYWVGCMLSGALCYLLYSLYL